MKRLIIDIDDTLCRTGPEGYQHSVIIEPVLQRIRQYRALGFTIVLHSSRNMRTYDGNLGMINANTLPNLIDWLARNNVDYDEIYVGKPWCGTDGFYVDDKAVRPIEFATMSYDEIRELLRMSNEELRNCGTE